jgi:hypothetical protein
MSNSSKTLSNTTQLLHLSSLLLALRFLESVEDCSKLDLIQGKRLAVLEFVTLLDNVGAFFFGLFLYNNNIIKVITYCYYIFHYVPL